MKAVFVAEPGRIELRDIPRPEPGGDEVLIKVRRAGICGSDIHLFKGMHAFRKPPAILGHEIAGDVVAVGTGVTCFKPGDRVTVNPQQTCGHCTACKSGRDNLCQNKRVPGTAQWIGSFAEYFPAPAAFVHPLADTVEYGHGVMVEPLAVAIHPFRKVGDGSGKSLAILGCGSIGLLSLFMAKRLGFASIVCTDTIPYNRDKALALGADAVIDPLTGDVRQVVDSITNGVGVDMTIIAAGSGNILDQAASITRKGGEIQLISMMSKPIPVESYAIVFKELSVFGSMQYTIPEFAAALAMVNAGADLEPLITHVFPAGQTQQAFDMLNGKSGGAVKILIDFDSVH